MATFTDKLNLVKPEMNEKVSPEPFNNNFDAIDSVLSKCLLVVSFDAASGDLVTKTYDYEG